MYLPGPCISASFLSNVCCLLATYQRCVCTCLCVSMFVSPSCGGGEGADGGAGIEGDDVLGGNGALGGKLGVERTENVVPGAAGGLFIVDCELLMAEGGSRGNVLLAELPAGQKRGRMVCVWSCEKFHNAW